MCRLYVKFQIFNHKLSKTGSSVCTNQRVVYLLFDTNMLPFSILLLPFFVLEILSDSTRLKICYSNINPVQRFFCMEILLFRSSHFAPCFTVTSQENGAYPKCLCGRWRIVVPFLLTATTYLTLSLVGSLEHINSSPTAAAHLHVSLYT